jgi:hypothetical protein
MDHFAGLDVSVKDLPSRFHRKLATAGSFWPEASMENVTKAFQPSSLFLASNSE